MARRPTLDAPTFEKLLTAAWVLQCEHDRKTGRSQAATGTAAALGREFPQTVTLAATRGSAEGRAPEWGKVSGSGANGAREPEHPHTGPIAISKMAPATVRSQGEVAGALALALQPQEHGSIPLAAASVPGNAGARQPVLNLVRLRAEKRATPVVRVIVPKSSWRAAAAVLIAAAVFLIPSLLSYPPGTAEVRSALRALKSTVVPGDGGQLQRAGGNAAQELLEASHLRVTDPDVAVDGLSRYEIRTLQRQARYGDDVAALTLGMVYETGRPLRQSCTEAAHWMAIAAADGNAAAQYNLALRYVYGDGVESNAGEARRWMREAAKQGYAKAIAALSDRQQT